MSNEEFDLDASRELALAEKYSYEAEYAKWQAAREELAYRQEQMEHDWRYDGVYSFTRDVTPKSVNKMLHTLSAWHSHNPDAPWTIFLNSVGGHENECYALVDELASYSQWGGGTHRVTIKVRGIAASAAGIILQAADWRVMGRNSQLMIHKGSGGIVGADVDAMADEVEYLRRGVDRMLDVFLSRTDRITRTQLLRKISRRDWWMSAAEAVDWGFADVIG